MSLDTGEFGFLLDVPEGIAGNVIDYCRHQLFISKETIDRNGINNEEANGRIDMLTLLINIKTKFIASKTAVIDAKRKEIDMHNATIQQTKRLAKNPDDIRADIERLDKDIDAIRAEIKRLDKDIERLDKDIDAIRAEIKRLDRDIERLDKEITGRDDDSKRLREGRMAICDRLSRVRSGCISSRSSSKNRDARRDAESTYFRDVKDASCTPHPTCLEVKKALDAIGISVASPEELVKPDAEERKWLEDVLVSPLFRAAFRVVCIRLHMSVSDEDVTKAANEYIQRLFIAEVNRPGLYGVTLPHPPCTLVARRHRAEMRITCLHEAAHFIRRWATNSTISTPRAAKLGDAEAGEILERVMFGGVLSQHKDSIAEIEARLDKGNFENPTTTRLYLIDDMPNVSSGSSATQKKVSFE